MDTKCCSKCARTRSLSCFLKNASAKLDTKVFSTCIPCRDQSKKRRVLQPLNPNRPSKGRVEPSTTTRPTKQLIPPLLQPRPVAVPPPLHSDILPQSESRPLFEARATPSMTAILPRVLPRPVRLVQPQPSLPVQHHDQLQPAGFLPPEQWGYIREFQRRDGSGQDGDLQPL
jgi:hypothetical protein